MAGVSPSNNTFLTPSAITKRALPLFINTNAFLGSIDRQYSDEFAKTGAKIGSNLRIRLPSDFTVASGPALAPQAVTQQQTNLTVTSQMHVDIAISSAEMALDVMEFDELILKPAMNRLAGYVANDVMSLVNTIPNAVYNVSGGNIVTPNQTTIAKAKAKLLQSSAPNEDIIAVFEPGSMANVGTQLTGLFNPTGRISEIFDSGEVVGPALGISKYMSDQLIPTTVVGGSATAAQMPTVNGAGQSGNTIVVNAPAGGASINVGDIITIAGVYQVNRVAKNVSARLRQFVVTQAFTGGTSTTLSVYPALNPLGAGNADVAFATVNASPANGAQISMVLPSGQSIVQNFAMHKKAFTLATVDLPLYDKGVVDSARENYSGISMRALQTYYPQTDQLIMRLDVLYGYAALRPEWAVMIPDVASQ